jgi:hypothetical protein
MQCLSVSEACMAVWLQRVELFSAQMKEMSLVTALCMAISKRDTVQSSENTYNNSEKPSVSTLYIWLQYMVSTVQIIRCMQTCLVTSRKSTL